MSRRIFITSYPYVYERYFRVFEYFPEKGQLTFILPVHWEAKKGSIQVDVPKRSGIEILPTRAYFTHSRYPLIRGLLKGWMPALAGILRRRAKPGDILYTAIEPNLLTTFFNASRARRMGLKHVFFTWQNVPYDIRLKGVKLRLTEWIIRGTIRNSAGAICGNHKAAEILKRYIVKPDFKVLVAPISGVDTDRFNVGIESDFRERYHLQGKTVLTFAGVFDERKGIRTLLTAFARVLKEYSNAHLVLIGTGPLRTHIDSFISRHGLQNDITVIPWLANDALPAVFANSDIFVHPSEPYGGWEEQFGYSMAEASACNVPVIATETGSIAEIVRDGVTGILVPPHNEDALSGAMLTLVRSASLRTDMGIAGRAYIMERFGHRVVAQKFNSLFETL